MTGHLLQPAERQRRDSLFVAMWNRGGCDLEEVGARYGYSAKTARSALIRAHRRGELTRPLRKNGTLAYEVPHPTQEQKAELLAGVVLQAGNYQLRLRASISGDPETLYAVHLDGAPVVSQLSEADAVRALWTLRAALLIGWKGRAT